MENNENEYNLILSIYFDIIEIEAMLKALKQIKADTVTFSSCSTDNVSLDMPMFANYLKEETIRHYTTHLEKLNKQLENL
jgi:hypothetical protein